MPKVNNAYLAMLLFFVFGCAEELPKLRDYPEFASAAAVVSMARNRVITVQWPPVPSNPSFRPDDGIIQIRPGEPNYDAYLEWVGALEPGQSKPIRVDNSAPNSN